MNNWLPTDKWNGTRLPVGPSIEVYGSNSVFDGVELRFGERPTLTADEITEMNRWKDTLNDLRRLRLNSVPKDKRIRFGTVTDTDELR